MNWIFKKKIISDGTNDKDLAFVDLDQKRNIISKLYNLNVILLKIVMSINIPFPSFVNEKKYIKGSKSSGMFRIFMLSKLCLLLINVPFHAQPSLTSNKIIHQLEEHFQLAKKYTYTNLDSALYYSVLGIQLIEKHAYNPEIKSILEAKKVDFLLRQGMVLQGQSKLDHSILKYEEAIKQAASFKKESINQIKLNYFSARVQRGDRHVYVEINKFKNSIDLTTENNISGYILLAYLEGRSYANKGDFENAIYTLIDVLALIEKFPSNKKYKSGTLNSISLYLNNMGDENRAEEFLIAAIKEAKESHLKQMLTLNLANFYFKRDQLELTKKYLSKIKKEEILAKEDLFTYTLLRYHLASSDVKNTFINSMDSIIVFVQNRNLKIQYFDLKSKFHFENKEYNTSLAFLDSIEMINKEIVGFEKVKNETSIVKDRLRNMIMKEENRNIILKYFKEHDVLSDSLEKIKLNSKTTEIIEKYQSIQKEIDNQRLTNKNLLLLNSNNLLMLKTESETNAKKEVEIANLKLELDLKESNSAKSEISYKNKLLEKEALLNTENLKNKNKLILIGSILILLIITLLSYVGYQVMAKSKLNETLTAQKNQIQLLNSELNHRVKNNLSFMTSLLEMQGRRSHNLEIKEALKESENRLKALALVHSQLFKSESDTEVNLKKYLQEVTLYLKEIFTTKDKPIEFETNYVDFQINAEDAMRLGLIVNELVTNSVKHAFYDVKNPMIRINTSINAAGKLSLNYADNGPKRITDLENNLPAESLGLKLISLLKKQLGDRYILIM